MIMISINGNKDFFNIVIKKYLRTSLLNYRMPGMQIVKDITLVKKNKGKELKG